jgi:hypothetical protein
MSRHGGCLATQGGTLDELLQISFSGSLAVNGKPFPNSAKITPPPYYCGVTFVLTHIATQPQLKRPGNAVIDGIVYSAH